MTKRPKKKLKNRSKKLIYFSIFSIFSILIWKKRVAKHFLIQKKSEQIIHNTISQIRLPGQLQG